MSEGKMALFAIDGDTTVIRGLGIHEVLKQFDWAVFNRDSGRWMIPTSKAERAQDALRAAGYEITGSGSGRRANRQRHEWHRTELERACCKICNPSHIERNEEVKRASLLVASWKGERIRARHAGKPDPPWTQVHHDAMVVLDPIWLPEYDDLTASAADRRRYDAERRESAELLARPVDPEPDRPNGSSGGASGIRALFGVPDDVQRAGALARREEAEEHARREIAALEARAAAERAAARQSLPPTEQSPQPEPEEQP